ncbi:alpha/beta hydrolase [Sphaerisporangium sp. NPDC005289]|uniref:alpha/beta fold hydrolase n=1 Tax=Sphaerisporangium sp. NPDC005289 TaxID=3155247 RepID=UPI0033AAD038
MSLRLLLACLVPVMWGAVAGLAMPRGPLTPAAALLSIGLGLAAGAATGYLARSRWAMLAAPVVFAAVFELLRIGASGPSVDAPRITLLGVLALITGRGVHGLLGLFPLTVGAAYGARPARGRTAGRLRRYSGRAVTGVLATIVAAVAIGVTLPATTAPIAGSGSVAELTTVSGLGLMIRGTDTANPVLLFVPGAPGAAERGAVRNHLAGLEQHFVMVTLDRRGGGSSYPAIKPTPSPESEADDILAVAGYLGKRFGKDRIYLLAHSGGTLPAVLAARRRPALFHAYIGVGQAVNTGAADRMQYADTLAWARAHRDGELAAALEAVGPPPYNSLYGYEPMLLAESRVYGEAQGGLDESVVAPEYSLLDRIHLFSGFLDAFDLYYPRAGHLDLRTRLTRLAIPAYFIDGADEVPARLRLMEEWYGMLEAPRKEHLVIPGTGHRSLFEQPDHFTRILLSRTLD